MLVMTSYAKNYAKHNLSKPIDLCDVLPYAIPNPWKTPAAVTTRDSYVPNGFLILYRRIYSDISLASISIFRFSSVTQI